MNILVYNKGEITYGVDTWNLGSQTPLDGLSVGHKKSWTWIGFDKTWHESGTPLAPPHFSILWTRTLMQTTVVQICIANQ